MRARRNRSRSPDAASDEYLLEFQQFGTFVKVAAVDPLSGVEVAIVGPASAGEAALTDVAIRKLRYVLGRRQRSPVSLRRRPGIRV